MEPCVFPKLQRLKFSRAVPFDYFRGSSFPALTYLHIKDDLQNYQYDSNIPKFIRLFPKLEILWFEGWIQSKGYDFKRKSEKFYQNQPKLKIIRAPEYVQAYMRDFCSTLQQIEIEIMDKEDVCELLQYFKSLKSLVANDLYLDLIGGRDYSKEKLFKDGYMRNDSIEVFKVNSVSFADIDRDEDLIQKFLNGNPHRDLQNLILAMPSLKELALDDCALTKETLKFIGKFLIYI
jgi:hypothetical protein